ncbi:MAG: phage integrase SAM-like domain-containing protein [Bacteroidales bacterium]|nr:phage integrase SAM-like domain-containing protein [Bacteroidales bacterium]
MGQVKSKHFEVKLRKDDQYFRLYVTHPNFKGRIRKRMGDRSFSDLENYAFTIRYELGKHFTDNNFTKYDVEAFIDNYVDMNVKRTASIFDYKEDFIKSKKERVNKKTRNTLSKSTISGYNTALKYFEEFLIKKRITTHPSQISEAVLNNFYRYITGEHNYKVKLHTKVKGFIKYLETEKRLPVDPSYKLSVFTEEYDNQCPDNNDIALTEDIIHKLFELRRKFRSGEVQLEPYRKSEKIPVELSEHLFNMKKENIIKCLDCFLFMVSTGQYYADIMKSKLFFSQNENFTHIRYRRAKNGSLCKSIPIYDGEIFCGQEIINQYQIKNGENFPLNLSLTHFDIHLGRISSLANIGFKITNKMARKTFASYLYFNKNLPIHYLQFLLGHKDVKDTAHYLRISDEDIANEVMRWTSNTPNK